MGKTEKLLSNREIVEVAFILSGATLGLVGSILIAPAIIGAGVAAAGVGAILRFRDHQNRLIAQKAQDNTTRA
jgi:hypothetical protein